jgi:ABC-type transport system involved in cytochrome bd biosynthesis fused ATPase/permease subunit
MRELSIAATEVSERPVLVAASIEANDECAQEDEARTRLKAGRSPVPDELYRVKLRELVDEAGGVVPSAREVARRLSVGQDRARRLITALKEVQPDDAELDTAS